MTRYLCRSVTNSFIAAANLRFSARAFVKGVSAWKIWELLCDGGRKFMKYADRNGKRTETDSKQDIFLKALYTHRVGRAFLGWFIRPGVSKFCGRLLNTRLSALAVPWFVKKNHIDLDLYEKREFDSWNDFFIRKMKPCNRPIDSGAENFISPCDARLSVSVIDENSHFLIKNTPYTVQALLRDKKLAARYRGGYGLVFRLTVEDYHHFCYADSGKKTANRKIAGVLHTVNPVANELFPIYKENAREYSILHSRQFGNVLMMEVGALMVGKIVNHHEAAFVSRGEEKGYFEFGGSTVVLLLERGRVILDRDLLENSQAGYETKVKMGEKIGKKAGP